jgi:two-component system, NtrC family, response regulator AtoC
MSSPSDTLDTLILRAATSSQSVLIWDEDVAERKSIATNIHDRSPRRANAFVHVTCGRPDASNDQGSLEVDLFGKVAGGFGALRKARPGILETASRGTVLIDDVATLDLEMQWRVFHASESRSTLRIGSTSETKIDVRFIFATAADLPELVKEGRFREDFFRAITGNAICLPPRDLSLPEPLEFERRYLEFPDALACPKCGTPSRGFRQLRDGYLVCGTCAQSFILSHA